MPLDPADATAAELMNDFGGLTGLTSTVSPRRYLWTDAFAVCNFLALHRRTGDEGYLELALRLVDQVHHVLGRHRPGDHRQGWISGLDEKAGEQHPTAGGLRIGKPRDERKPQEPLREHLEWEQDGQYYHYLTKWMHALLRVSQATGEARYHRWAVELAQTAHARFTYAAGSRLRMYWKMSIDLSYPLVSSQGQHDPLDGWITYRHLQAKGPRGSQAPEVSSEIEQLAAVCDGAAWVTSDPLGIGGLLTDVHRLADLGTPSNGQLPPLLEQVAQAALRSLEGYARSEPFRHAASQRLAFRELGLSIGLRAMERLQLRSPADVPRETQVERFRPYVPLADEIEAFWLQPPNHQLDSWLDHREINMVMLATSLAPDGFLAAPVKPPH